LTIKNPKLRKIAWVLLAGMAGGAAVWGLSIPITGMREPFDSPTIYYWVAMFIAGILGALPAPRYWWVAVIGVFLGEQIYCLVMLPENRSWLLFGIYMHVLVLNWVPPAIGAFLVYIVYRIRTWRAARNA
jgi:hypothetical protein